MTTNYLRHPGYAEYPVVGVNWIQAVQFCQWRTDRVNESVLEREGYIAKGVKTDSVDAGSTFSTEAYLTRPKETYGGQIDEFKAESLNKQIRSHKILQIQMYMQNVLLESFYQNIVCQQKLSGNMPLKVWMV